MRGWKVEKKLAVNLLKELVDRFERTDEVIAYTVVQAIKGIEHHGVAATDLDLRPLIAFLIEKCPAKLYCTLSEVASSLQAIGYPHQA